MKPTARGFYGENEWGEEKTDGSSQITWAEVPEKRTEAIVGATVGATLVAH